MAKQPTICTGRRAYINPVPGYSEAQQRADIVAKFDNIDEWYIESKTVTRAGFIGSLRAGNEAVVAKMGCLAKPSGRIDARMFDLVEARGDVHARCCVVVDSDGQRSDSKGWLPAKAAAREFLRRLSHGAKSKANASARKYNLTDAQVRRVLEVRDSKRYTNDNQRLAALKKEGIEIGRTFMVTTVPVIARERGITI